MLDREYGKIVFSCDACEETLETETTDFYRALDMLRTMNWTVKNIRGEWCHVCPEHAHTLEEET